MNQDVGSKVSPGRPELVPDVEPPVKVKEVNLHGRVSEPDEPGDQ